MIYRSQLSLKFMDEDLYLKFIKPLVDSKELTPMIIKLLASYYYNDATRQAVDGVSIESLRQNEDYVTDDQKALREKIADIRASAQVLNMFIEDTQSTLEEGMAFVNEVAKATGGQSRSDSSDNGAVPRISSVGFDNLAREAESAKRASEETDSKYEEVKQELSEVKSNIALILQMLQSGNNSVSVTPVSQVPLPSQEVKQGIPAKEQEVTVVSKEIPPVEYQEPSESDKLAGRSRILDLVSGGGVGGFMG